MNMKKVVGSHMPLSDAIETGSEEVGHGLLLKWTTNGEAVIHCIADLESEQRPNVTWLEARILHSNLSTVIITDIPLMNAVVKKHKLVNTILWNQRVRDVWEMYPNLQTGSFNR